ncbi:EAL domain-containing protein [Aerosakkonemataceae cyanobacterium BLCC-F154]|uniref:EAL domain-containing protein n=1 Tax=Floridaenema fluviatile BLCC-F154 TaxID=3153640 RepID=A0ABV4YEF5_9CYAN
MNLPNILPLKSQLLFLPELNREKLNIGSTLQDLTLYRIAVSPECSTHKVAKILTNNTLLPGVVIAKDNEFVGVISRSRFFEYMSRPYSVELFFKKPIHIFYKYLHTQALIIPQETSIVTAAKKALKRPKETLYEPIVVKLQQTDRAVYKLLDMQQLLLAQLQIHQLTMLALESTQKALVEEKDKAQVTLCSIGDAVITTDALGKIEFLNPVAERLTGWLLEEAQGKLLIEVFNIINESSRNPVKNPVETVLESGCTIGLANHTILIARGGDEFAIANSAAPIRTLNGETIGAILVFHDVTSERQLTHLLSWQASHDTLTGLVNRYEFERQLEEALLTAKLENQQHTLCYLDLDQFKIVNDTCGHVAGDELLRQITALLQSKIRIADTLARLGGDEFGLLLRQCPLNQGTLVAKALHETIQKFRFLWEDKNFSVGISIGLTAIDDTSQTVATLMSAADAACYTAKNRGRDRIQVYQANDSELLQQHGQMQWVSRINKAFEENRFRLYCQGIVPINSFNDNFQHYEVLLRLIDEEGQLVSPMAFIPAAERYNLMPKIDRWVISTLFANQSIFYRKNPHLYQSSTSKYNCLYAINLSGASINDEQFIDFLHQQFILHRIPPETICFEITETVAIINLSKATQFIHSLKQFGCRFALDDFGSGMSSFAYLKNLPVDYLKIDGEFVKDIEKDRVAGAMVEAINHIGQLMGLQTIAEFVENDNILEKVKALGVNYAQGYGISKPLPLTFSSVPL